MCIYIYVCVYDTECYICLLYKYMCIDVCVYDTECYICVLNVYNYIYIYMYVCMTLNVTFVC